MSNLDYISYYGDWTFDDALTINLITYLKHGLLEIGAYYNVSSTGQLNSRGINVSKLNPVAIPGQTNYTIYRGLSNDWVYERNFTPKYTGGSLPLAISGIYVNNVFYPTGSSITGTGYYVDYSRGQVVFNQPLSSGTDVRCLRTERRVSIVPADESDYRSLYYDWMSGNASGITDFSNKLYLPTITVNLASFRTIRGTELGSRTKYVNADFEFDIYTNNAYENNKLSDIVYALEEKAIPLFNLKNIIQPLNNRGELIYASGNWPEYIANQFWMYARFGQNARITKYDTKKLPIYHSRVKMSLELDTYPF